jgi:magnesium and cobalt transporter
MKDDTSGSPPGRSWLERVTQALLGEPKDQDQLRALLRDAQRRELLDADALAMIEGVLEVTELRVRDIMVPRSQMTVVERDAALEQILPRVVESAHSRFPVIGDSRDEVVGILLAKDLLGYYLEDRARRFDVRDVLRPVAFIPESKRLNMLLKEFRSSRNHMAVVVDEYGGVAGLVTIEDVLEQIVGEIEDETDVEEDLYIQPQTAGQYLVRALTPIEEVNAFFGTAYSHEEFDTIGGLVMSGFGHLPKRGERVAIGDLQFRVVSADARRIHLLQVSRAGRKEPSAAPVEEPTKG